MKGGMKLLREDICFIISMNYICKLLKEPN